MSSVNDTKKWTFSAGGTILIYSGALAILILSMKYLDWRYTHMDLSTELYKGLTALFFTSLGIWTGLKYVNATKGQTKSVPDVNAQIDELGISKREYEILILISRGLSNQEIADQLFISLATVKSHASSLYQKLSVRRRSQAIAKAKTLKILP